jgi:hypothetical protein
MDGTNGLTFDEGALRRLRIRVLQGIEVDVFYAGTPIQTKNGPRAIETIQPGDLVWCQMAPCH